MKAVRRSLETEDDVYNQALRFLTVRFLSRKELYRKLKNRGASIDHIESVIDRLEDIDYVNDERLAEDVARLFVEEAKYGRRHIERKMRERGLEPPENLRAYDERSAAFRRAEARFGPPGESDATRAKLASFLQNRGFSSSTAYAVLEAYGV